MPVSDDEFREMLGVPASSAAGSISDDEFKQMTTPGVPAGVHTESRRPTNYGAVVARGLVNSVPFANDAAALVDTGASYLPQWALPNADKERLAPQQGKSFGDRYKENLATERKLLEEDESQHPYVSYGSQIAGAFALPMGAADSIAGRVAGYVPGAVARSLGAGAVGAGYGAAYGASSGDGLSDRLDRAKTGAMVGGVGGSLAPVVAGAGRSIYGRIAPLAQGIFSPEAAASAKIADSMASRQPAELGMTPRDLMAAQASGQPTMVADLGGEGTRRLARSVANVSPEAAGSLKPPIYQRYQDQAKRFGDFMQDLFGTNLNNQDALDAIRSIASSENTPAYAAAYNKGSQGVWNADLANLVQSPAIKSAIKEANTRAVNDAVLKKQPIVRNPFTTDTGGNFSLAQDANGNAAIPTLQYWDQVKRALDDQVSSAYAGGNRSLGMQVGQLRDHLLSTLDGAVPEYQTAREGAWNWLGARDAVTAGQKFLGQSNNVDVNSVKKWLSSPNITASQREAFAQGLAGQIFQKAQNASDNRNIVNMFNSPEFRDKMAVGLGQTRSDAVEAYLRRESMMDALRQKVMGNSTTTEQIADSKGSIPSSILSHLGSGLANPISAGAMGAGAEGWRTDFDPHAMLRGAVLGSMLGPLSAGHAAINSKVATAIAEKLSSSDPQDIQWAIKSLTQTPGGMDAMRHASQALITAGSRPVIESSPQSGQHPYARGGPVKRKSHDQLVSRLMSLVEKAKREEKQSTKQILNIPDSAVAHALAKAQEAI